jgi:hypothetical protein
MDEVQQRQALADLAKEMIPRMEAILGRKAPDGRSRLPFEEGFSMLSMLVRERIIIKTVTEWSPEFGFIGYLQDVTDDERSTTLHFDDFRVTFKRFGIDRFDPDAYWVVEGDGEDTKLTLHQRDGMSVIHRAPSAR